MPDIANVNLLFLRRARGVAPLSRYALSADGSLLAAVPDEMEARTTHLVRFSAAGRSQIETTYSVETLQKTEVSAETSRFLGITDDDLYLFVDGRKTRFLPDRRVAYIDVSLAEDGVRFACAFSDLLQSGSSIGLGDTAGRLLWHKDVGFPIAAVSLSRDAGFVAVAGESGDLLLLDRGRQTIYVHRQDAPLRKVATLGSGRTLFACDGGVGCVDETGGLLWYTELVGTPVELAVAGGGTSAVLLGHAAGGGRLVFLSSEGMPGYDIDFDEALPTGLALSRDGARAAVSLKDGSVIGYELDLSARLGSLADEVACAEVRRTLDAGNLPVAVKLLEGRLSENPADQSSARLYVETVSTLTQRLCAQASAAEKLQDFHAADALLADALRVSPFDPGIAAERSKLRARWRDDARARAEASAGEDAENGYLDALTADPLCLVAREGLARARQVAARDAVTRGKKLLAIGEFSEALAAFLAAWERGATDSETANLIRDARIAEAVSTGNALYRDRQYAAALFQFKKALRLEPNHPEALRKISYAQNFLADAQINERFRRLE